MDFESRMNTALRGGRRGRHIVRALHLAGRPEACI